MVVATAPLVPSLTPHKRPAVCKALMVPSQRCCGMEALLPGDIPSMVVTAVVPGLHRERWKGNEVERAPALEIKVFLQGPTKQSFLHI